MRAIVAPLKALKRVTEKAAEKYDGDFSRVTDLARATLECETLAGVRAVIAALAADGEWTVVLIKNRLMEEFDASETGGYRDVLVNVLSARTAQLAEVQVTLRVLLGVKHSGGHAAYQLTRILDLNSKEHMEHKGELSGDVLARIEFGMIRKLELRGKGSRLGEHFDRLRAALEAPSCLVASLWISGADWPVGRPLADLLTPRALAQLAPRLTALACCGDENITGMIPAGVWGCTRLRYLACHYTALEGELGAGVGALAELRSLNTSHTRLSGPVPVELGRLTQLRDIDMSACHHAGELPWAVLARLPRDNARFNFSGQHGGGFTNLDEVRHHVAELEPHDARGGAPPPAKTDGDELTERAPRLSASQRQLGFVV